MATGTWIYEKGTTSGGGSGGGGTTPDSPNVIIPALTPGGETNPQITELYDGKFEVTVYWEPGPGANAENFKGVAVFVEDPDISSKAEAPMDNTVPLDSSAQISGHWYPVRRNDNFKSPAVVILDGARVDRAVRVYLRAFGKATNAIPVRANQPNPTPNVVAGVPAMSAQYISGLEYAWLVTDCHATPVLDFDNPAGPQWWLVYSYKPPSDALPLPPGMKPFGGVVTFYEHNNDGNFQLNQFLDVLDTNHVSWKTAPYAAGAGDKLRVWFASRDIDGRVNDVIKGFTPYDDVEVIYPPVGQASAPYITNLALGNYRHDPRIDGTDMALADLTWTPPTSPRYATVEFFRTSPLPVRSMHALVGNTVNKVTLEVNDWPKTAEAWTIVAISADFNGKQSDNPAAPSAGAPRVIWNIGPPGLGTPGGGIEYTPIGGVAGASIVTEQQLNSDGVVMMRHKITNWTNPTDNTFGGMTIERVYPVGDYPNATVWDAPKGATSFTTDWEPAPGDRTFDFYFVSRDMAGHRNSIAPGITPKISHPFTPMVGNVLASRLPKDWFNEAEFEWPAGAAGKFTVEQIVAPKIYVGSILRVGGGPGTAGATGLFDGMYNGQIAVYNSSNVLRAWAGQQDKATTPDNPTQHSIFGGWFAELYVGGDGPPTAPLYANQAGAVIVGGFEMTAGVRYPYLGIRDNTGTECGRIGARIGYSAAGNQTGPEVTIQGAWFKELAFGGTNFADWRVLSKMETGSVASLQLRNVDRFTIDYAANYGLGSTSNQQNAAQWLEFGYQAFVTDNPNDSTYYKFPGIALYRKGTNPKHGIAIINRGIVIRQPVDTGSPVGNLGRCIALVSYNGDPKGSDSPNYWWGDLSMNSPQNGAVNVQLSSGTATTGHSSFTLRDGAGQLNFSVGTAGDVTIRGTLTVSNLSLTTLTVSGASGMAGVTCTSLTVNGATTHNGQVNAAGYAGSFSSLNVGGQVQGGSFYTTGNCSAGNYGAVACTSINNSGPTTLNGGLNASSSLGSFANLNVSGNVSCASLTVTTFNPASVSTGTVTCTTLRVGTQQRIDSDGVYRGSLQWNDHVYAGDFGIMAGGAGGGGVVGVTRTFTVGGVTIAVYGGIICSVTP